MNPSLQNLNALGSGASIQKATTRLSTLPINEKFIILRAKRVTTPFGPAVLVELESTKVFLPTRFSKMSDEDLEYLNSGKVHLTYTGRVEENNMDTVSFCVD
ncbi:uncharacterized protein LOC124615992 [Schistocerca americana]|uniref:uncharacterized protein LOC124615992 n=1 Tax=Schistocerca americana TaxID=7009 RepID=UPI001F4F702D|nr:uncharacterized protein LOC124615992 [Schistocerca americana]